MEAVSAELHADAPAGGRWGREGLGRRVSQAPQALADVPEWQHDTLRIAEEMLETEHYLPVTGPL